MIFHENVMVRPENFTVGSPVTSRCLEHILKAENLELSLIRGYCPRNKEPLQVIAMLGR